MMPDAIKSFIDNYSERIKKPFGGTFIAAWTIHNWKILIILFSGDLIYSQKVSEIEFYIKCNENYLLLIPLGYAFVAILLYPVFDLAGAAINAIYTRHLRRIVFNKIGYKNYVPKKEYEDLQNSFSLEKDKNKNVNDKYYKTLDDLIKSVEERNTTAEKLTNVESKHNEDLKKYTLEVEEKNKENSKLLKDNKKNIDEIKKLVDNREGMSEQIKKLEIDNQSKFIKISAYYALTEFSRFYDTLFPANYTIIFNMITLNDGFIKVIDQNHKVLYSDNNVLFLGSSEWPQLHTRHSTPVENIEVWNSVKTKSRALNRSSWINYTNQITIEEANKGGVYNFLYMFYIKDMQNVNSARLTMFADDYAEVSINNSLILSETHFDFQKQEVRVIPISKGHLSDGVNILYFRIRNAAHPNANDPSTNPTGLIFALDTN